MNGDQITILFQMIVKENEKNETILWLLLLLDIQQKIKRTVLFH